MRQLLYVSNAARDIAPRALDAILSASRANNVLLGITGLLLHIDGGFLQILEGDERAVRELYARIAADRRHREPRTAHPAGPRDRRAHLHRLQHGLRASQPE
jgi:hypothetical protein